MRHHDDPVADADTAGLIDFNHFARGFVAGPTHLSPGLERLEFSAQRRCVHLDQGPVFDRLWISHIYERGLAISRDGCLFHSANS